MWQANYRDRSLSKDWWVPLGETKPAGMCALGPGPKGTSSDASPLTEAWDGGTAMCRLEVSAQEAF